MSANELLQDLTDIFPPLEIGIPTKGIFYPPGILQEGLDPMHIQVRTLGMMDEFKYRDPFMLVTGKAIEHLISHLCGDQIIKPEALCEIDVETILIAARIASYGPNLKMKHICGQKFKDAETGEESICNQENTIAVDLNEHILRYEPLTNEEQFEMVLPRVGQTVYLKPVTYQTTAELTRAVMQNRRRAETIDMGDINMAMRPEDFATYEEIFNLSYDIQIKAILDCIWAVKTRSGVLVEDPTQIGAWIFELPKTDSDEISKRISEITDGFRKLSLMRYQCARCKQDNEFHLQMNPEILFLVESEDSAEKPISSDFVPTNRNSSRPPSRISPKRRSISVGP